MTSRGRVKWLAFFTVCLDRYNNTMKPVYQSKTTVKKDKQYAMSSTCFWGCCGQCECCCCVDPAYIKYINLESKCARTICPLFTYFLFSFFSSFFLFLSFFFSLFDFLYSSFYISIFLPFYLSFFLSLVLFSLCISFSYFFLIFLSFFFFSRSFWAIVHIMIY